MSYLKTKKLILVIVAYRVCQLWKNVPEEIRNSISFPVFKESIEKVPLIFCSVVRNISTT